MPSLGRGLQSAFVGAGALTLMLFATGCPEPADLENPPVGPGPGGGSGPSGGSGGSGQVVCESPCIQKLFTMDQTCKLCHGTAIKLSGLDLQSAGYTDRLKDKSAKHLDGMDPEMPLPASAGCGTNDLLINTANPAESWLWKKVSMGQGMCGDPMPQTTPIKPADQACIKTYIECVAQKPIAASGGAPAATGGTGGVATGSGGTGGT